MLLVGEIEILLLLSSLLSTPESFAYLFVTYIIVKIARSWFKGCLPAALGGGSDDEDYDLLGTSFSCHNITYELIAIQTGHKVNSFLYYSMLHNQNENMFLCIHINLSNPAKPIYPYLSPCPALPYLPPPPSLQIQQVKDTRQQPIIQLVQ